MAAPFPVLPGEVAPVGAGESAGEEATMVPGGEGILGCGSVTPEAWKTEVISKQCPPRVWGDDGKVQVAGPWTLVSDSAASAARSRRKYAWPCSRRGGRERDHILKIILTSPEVCES